MLAPGSYLLGFLAGVLTVLSPCVLPLLPIVLGGAVASHRYGAVALSIGAAFSFVVVGLFVASIGFAAGLDGDLFRTIGSVLLAGFGVLLLSQALQDHFAVAATPMGACAQATINRLNPTGLGGQAILGSLLGLVWSPCVGPTLGVAVTLAAQRQTLPQVATVMLLFGLGAALPMLIVGTLSREALMRWRGGFVAAGKRGKQVLGAAMLILAIVILTGADRQLETTLVGWSPHWLTALTTRY
ncbi:MAG TPA: cytochrome c biogenesis CcdA family protein [Xanthobacteraceae bacterium]|nr:cytochrome c biogenesis CcdA family protein [Xanthobacteraceae bacterium]